MLWVDDVEVPGAFDGVDQGGYGTGPITFDLSDVLPESLEAAVDGRLEFTFDLDRTQTLPYYCTEYFSIDFARLTVVANKTID